MAGIFSSCIHLLYLSSPLYLMQVYNRVLVNENITTLILLTLVLAVALLAMAALDTIRAQILIPCGIRLDQMLAARGFQWLHVKSATQDSSGGPPRLRALDALTPRTTS